MGLDNYRVYAPRYVSGPGQLTFVNFIAERPHVVHNVYLQTMVEVGLVGLGLFLAIIISSLAAAMRAARRFEGRGDYESAALSAPCSWGCSRRSIASFFISNGNGFQIWVLLAFGPMLCGWLQREEDHGARCDAGSGARAAGPAGVTRRAPAWQA